ncbi:MAG: NTP transferase domain-containing protein, partial [Ornithinimicrobium sp.]
MTSEVAFAAVVLAGGQGTRLGGTDKALLDVGGASLLSRVLDAVNAAERVVVVGPRRPGFEHVCWTAEEPSGGGPSAGIVAGM